MLATSSYTWLLLLTICCLYCMAHKQHGKKHFPDRAPHSEEHSYSEESSSNSKESSSHSKENSSEDDCAASIHKAPTCTDRKRNQGETDIDCGGKKCAKCADRKRCKFNRDCISGSCKYKKCAPTEQSTKPTIPANTTVTTPKKITTTESTTTESTTAEPTTTESTTTEPTTTEPTTTEPTTTEPTTTESTTIPICALACKNGGTCAGHNICICTTGFSGPICEVQSVGLCLDNETFNAEPILLITFGNGSAQYSSVTPNDFDFSTTYQQQFEPVTNDGMFSFINSIHDDFAGAWHTGATDHTGDEGGYMYLVNADIRPGQFYNGRVDNLCIGLRYEFSVYLANLCKPNGKINPNVLFEVRSTDENILLAQLNSSNIVEQETLTWEKYGFSFIAPSSSVNLLMISNAPGGVGNDLVIDDIALRVCANQGSGFCPSK